MDVSGFFSFIIYAMEELVGLLLSLPFVDGVSYAMFFLLLLLSVLSLLPLSVLLRLSVLFRIPFRNVRPAFPIPLL